MKEGFAVRGASRGAYAGWIGSPWPTSVQHGYQTSIGRAPRRYGQSASKFSTQGVWQSDAKTHVNGTERQATVHAASTSTSNGTANAARSAVRKPGMLMLVPTFVLTHFTLAWALVPPIYFTLRQTNMGNALLAGPQGAWLLSRRVPEWVPDVVIDGMVGGSSASREEQHHQLTVEQLIERLARRGIRIGWKYASYGGAALKGLRKVTQDEDQLAKEATQKLGAKEQGEAAMAESQVRNFASSIKGYTTKQARTAADEIEFGQIRDGIAAWVLVKLLFPIRLPVSIFLTPRVARTLTKAFGR